MRVVLCTLLFVSAISYGQKASKEFDTKLLIGDWTSEDDKKYTIVVTNSTFVEYYDNEKMGVFSYKIDKDKLIKTDRDDGEVYKYDIMNLTNQRLTLLYLSRGNVLLFTKTK
jgi:hypothetical protein